MKKCNCFTCKNNDNLDRLYGYYYAEYHILKNVIENFKRLGIKQGKIEDKTIDGLYACLSYECGCAGVFLKECEENIKKTL